MNLSTNILDFGLDILVLFSQILDNNIILILAGVDTFIPSNSYT